MSFYPHGLGFGEPTNYAFQEPNMMVQKEMQSVGFGGFGDQRPSPSSREAPTPPSRSTYSPRTKADDDMDLNLNSIREEMLRTGRLFQDPTFPADTSSLFPSRPFKKQVVWKRPHELVANPKFFVDGASRFDVKQGELGDCWLLAAVSNLTLHPRLFDNIVRPGQTFAADYCGLFRFRFWWFGKWLNVEVDDRLPTINGKLAYMYSADGNEFWSALLEKAYAKLHGSYEALSGGRPSNAMDDFTGGVSEFFDLKSPPHDLFDIILRGFERGSLIAGSTEPNPQVYEERCSNGIIKGHAYSITCVTKCQVTDYMGRNRIVSLLRIRNPWGNEAEWNGPWSDRSPEWLCVPERERLKLGLTFEHDGEFWMEYKDFLANFNSVEMTNVHLESLVEEDLKNHVKHLWEVKTFEGYWIRGVSAGGCQNFPKTFWSNPKFFVTLREEDDGNKDMKCTLIVALLQRPREQRQVTGKAKLLTIGFAVHPVPSSIVAQGSLNVAALKATPEVRGLDSYVNLRQISHRYHLQPGTYCIIPSTYQPDEEADFILRLFCEKPYSVKQKDNPVGFNLPESKVLPQAAPALQQEAETKMRGVFQKVAGADNEIDWKELQDLLHKRFGTEFPLDGFSRSACRSLIAMMDSRSGKLGLDGFIHLWNIICIWKKAFQTHDKDASGKLTGYEFRDALLTSGFDISNKLFTTLMTIYADEARHVTFDDFVLCAIRMSKMMKTFQEKDPTKTNCATFSLEEFLEQVMCI